MKQLPLSKNHMRCQIESVPKDGTAVILEDEAAGRYELVRWSSEQGTWVSQDGKACQINASHWHSIRANHYPGQQDCASSNPFRVSVSLRNSMDLAGATNPPLTTLHSIVPLADASSATADELKSRPKSDSTIGVPAVSSQAARTWHVRQFCLGAALIGASLAGFYFRADVIALAAHRAEPPALLLGSFGPQTSLDDAATLPNAEPSTLADVAAVAVSAGSLARAAENGQRYDAAVDQVTNLRQELDRNAEQSRQALAEARRREEDQKAIAAQLQLSLQEARDKILSLENELTLSRQNKKEAVLSGRHGRRVVRRSQRPWRPQGFFGETLGSYPR